MGAIATGMGKTTTTNAKPRVLIVDDEPAMVELIDDVVGHSIGCRLLSAGSVSEARKILASQPIELMVADVRLPDGDGMSLVSALNRCQPQASAMIVTGDPSVDRAIQALRSGAIDFLPKPFTSDQLLERVRLALRRQSLIARGEKRLLRLRDAVKRLNEARKIVSRKVDLLCNDLISAYGELSKQFDRVRTQEGFRKYISQSNDLEQMLCHAMDWLLRQVGYSNVAIWLAADDQKFQLGAYMKYTIPGSEDLTTAMGSGIIKHALREGSLHLSSDEARDRLTPAEIQHLAGQTILAVNCTYLAEPLAVVVLFRDEKTPFSEDHAAALQMISPIFAVSLASAVRPSPDDGDADDDSGPQGPDDHNDDSGHHRKSRGRSADADWWKRGEPPPF